MRRARAGSVLAILALTAGACSARPAAERPAARPTATIDMAVASRAAVEGVRFPSTFASTGSVTLHSGQAHEDMPGQLSVQLDSHAAAGDLNGDGSPDTAVVLVSNPGGSGTFFDLYAVLRGPGPREALPPVNLGDRVAVQGVTIQDGLILVRLKTRRADEPMAAEPSVDVTHTFKVAGGTLVQTGP